jgi:acetate---CoA ligase (ADP-forming)
VPAFAAPESCAAAFSAMLSVGTATGQDGAEASPPDGTAPDVSDLGSGSLNEAESKALFARFGVPVAREMAVATPAAAEEAARQLGGPVVLKILSRHILHKTEVGGVAVNVRPEEVAGRCEAMAAAVKRATDREIEGFLVQELVQGGTELILGFHRDPQLGPTILLGMGGVTTELFKDTAIRLPPIGRHDTTSMVDELKSGALLKGFRGRPKGDLEALASAIMAFAGMALALGERLVEAEINPLFVLPEGQGVRAADGLVVLR